MQIEKEIIGLTNLSKEQSDGYIQQVVAKLADARTDKSVSTLERVVVGGAHFNSMSQMAIQKLFYRMLSQPAAKEELKTFMAQAIQNTLQDEKKLANTPFFGMAQKARMANGQIDDFVKEYITNIEDINRDKAACDRQITALSNGWRETPGNSRSRPATALSALLPRSRYVSGGLVTMVLNAVFAHRYLVHCGHGSMLATFRR